MCSWPQEEESESSRTCFFSPSSQPSALVWMQQAFSQQTEVSVDILNIWELRPHMLQAVTLCVSPDLCHDGLWGSVLQQPSVQMSQQREWLNTEAESATVYLSQVDVNGVLQELRSLPGPLLNGQHADSFHTGLQLDHSSILILRHNKERDCGHRLLDACTLQPSKGMFFIHSNTRELISRWRNAVTDECAQDSPVARFSGTPTHVTTENQHTCV